MTGRLLAGLVVLTAIVLVGPVVVVGEPMAASVLAAKPDKTPPAKGRPTDAPEPPKGPRAPTAPPPSAPAVPATQVPAPTAVPAAPATARPRTAPATPRPATARPSVRPSPESAAPVAQGSASAEPGVVVGSVDASTSPDRSPSSPGVASGDPGSARETKAPVMAAFAALGIVGGSVVVLAAVQRRRHAKDAPDAASVEVPPPFTPSDAQLAALENDPLMAALNRRSRSQAPTAPEHAPAWVRRMRSQADDASRETWRDGRGGGI